MGSLNCVEKVLGSQMQSEKGSVFSFVIVRNAILFGKTGIRTIRDFHQEMSAIRKFRARGVVLGERESGAEDEAEMHPIVL